MHHICLRLRDVETRLVLAPKRRVESSSDSVPMRTNVTTLVVPYHQAPSRTILGPFQDLEPGQLALATCSVGLANVTAIHCHCDFFTRVERAYALDGSCVLVNM